MSWDVLIRHGLIIDGSGRPGAVGDIALAGGRIAALGASLTGDAKKFVDAQGLAVTPGFIDIKTHSDFVLPINPKAESKVRQGVTTEIVGHCGFSVAPVLPGKARLLADYLSGGAPWLAFREMRFPEYLDTFPAVAVNTGMLDSDHLSITGVVEVVFAFSGAEFGNQLSNSATKSWNSSFGGLAQKRLQFAERLLDRIEIGRVFWQVKQCCTGRCDEPLNRDSLVCRQIVDDDEVAAPKNGPQTLFEIGKEAGSVHRPVHHERRNHLVVTKPGYKGHRLPMPLRHAADQPLATPAAAPQPRHIGRS